MHIEQPVAGYTGTPQTEDGFTRIANELLEAICAFKFSSRQRNIVFAIIRKTYGYNKSSDDISTSQISDITNIARNHVSETINELEMMNVITREQGKYGFHIGINKHYDSWFPIQDSRIRTPESGLNQSRIRTFTVPNQDSYLPDSGPTIDNSKRQLQKTTPKDKAQPKKPAAVLICPEGVSSQVWEDFLSLRQAKKATFTNTALIAMAREAKKAGVSLQTALETCCLRGWVGFKADWVANARGSPQKAPSKLDSYLSNFKDKENENERDITGIAVRVD